MIKKAISIFLIVTVLCSFSVTNTFAGQTLCQKVGIGEIPSSNTQVINLGDSLGVFSSSHSSAPGVDGYSLLALLVGSTQYPISPSQAVTDAGYSLEYITPSGFSDPSQLVQHGGYVRATKDNESINIPIVDIYHLKSYDESQIGTDWQNTPPGTSISRGVAALAGKSANDKAFQITVNPETSVKSTNPARADNYGIDTLNTPKTVVTIEFEIRVTGDAVALVERNGGYSLLRLKSDGTMTFKSYDAGDTMVDVAVCSDASEWHNIALTYDYAGGRIIYYFDGEKLEPAGARTSDAVLSEIRFALDNISYTAGGTVAVDNVHITRGYYKPFGLVELTSSDDRIQVLSSEIAVFSDPSNPEYFISSDKLLSALSVDDDYTLEYVDNSKVLASVDCVQSGYIRITNLIGKHHYIPIAVKGASFAAEFGKGCTLHNDGGSIVSESLFALGAKAEDDAAYGFSVGDSALEGVDGLEYTTNNTTIPYTYVFNVYADGDTVAQVDFLNNQNQISLLKWGSDGTLQCNRNSVMSDGITLQRGMWHQLSIVYNSNTSHFSLYADGVLVTDKLTSASAGDEHKLLFAIASGSTNGTVAFDDLDAYAGFYYPPTTPITTLDGANVFVDCGRAIAYYDCSTITTTEAFVNALKENTNASEIRLYEDFTFSTEASELNENTVVVVASNSPKRYLYLKPSADYIKLSAEKGKISASYYAPQENRVLILALYDYATLSDIVVKQMPKAGTYTAELEYDRHHVYKAFVRESDLVTPISCFEGYTDDTQISDRVIMNCDFENTFPLFFHKNGSVIEPAKDDDGNTSVLFKRVGSGDFHLSAMTLNGQSDCMVLEFDFKVANLSSQANFIIQDGESHTAYIGQLLSGGYLRIGGHNEKIEADTWYKLSAVVNSYERSIEYYLNNQKLYTVSLVSDFALNSRVNLLRFYVPSSQSGTDNSVEFSIDNLRIYESAAPKANLDDIEIEVVLSGKSVFESDDAVQKSLGGYFAVHTRSGVAYANGSKTQLQNKPYAKDGTVYVDASELSEVFELKAYSDGNVPIEEFALAHELQLTKVNSSINSGLYILGASSFDVPADDKELKKLNDYMLYLRPTPQMVADSYIKSPLCGVHPRIQATASDFERIRAQAQTDPYMKTWKNSIVALADSLVKNDTAVKYELRDGVRLLMVSREVLNNMYALGMAYQLTGDSKYVTRAWTDLQAVCNFYDWHPGHDIDCAEMCAAVAIGYDWMYHGLNTTQKQTIEKALYEKGLHEAVAAYQTTNAAMSGMAYGGANRNVVCNSGVIMASLALMDIYPEICSFVVSCGVRAVELVLYRFAPDGAYYEGPSYWEYTMQYASKLISSLDSALAGNFGLESLEGLSVTTDYMLHMQTANGIYCYGDGNETAKLYVPEMLWLAKKYNRKDNASAVMTLTNGNFFGGEDWALALLWYDTSTQQADITMATHGYFKNEDTFSIRDSWQSGGSYLGVHAGVSHTQLDGGSFIYETDGIRWAIDPGSGDYNQTGYFDSGENGRKWNIFYCRAESHNTLVVNPSLLPDHIVNSYAPMTVEALTDSGAIVTVDTTALHRDVASSKRGFMFTDNRRSLVIRDEVSVTKESNVYWFMQTRADVTVDEAGATLTKNGKTLRLDFASNASATIEVADAEPLPTSPIEENDRYGDFKRIVIKAHGDGNVNITVKFTPSSADAPTPLSDYNKSIDTWTLDN